MTENEAIERIKKDACNNSCMIPQLCKDGCMYGHTKCAFSMAIKALEEVQQYRQICTPEVLALATKLVNIAKNCGTIGKVIDEWVDYKEIGTVEECRKAVEKQMEKKVITNHSWTHYHFYCPICKAEVNGMKYCPNCGQKLDWRDDDGN